MSNLRASATLDAANFDVSVVRVTCHHLPQRAHGSFTQCTATHHTDITRLLAFFLKSGGSLVIPR